MVGCINGFYPSRTIQKVSTYLKTTSRFAKKLIFGTQPYLNLTRWFMQKKSTQIVFGRNISPTFFWPKYLFNPIFVWPTIFFRQHFFQLKVFLTQVFFPPTFFLQNNTKFCSKFFRPKFFLPKCFFRQIFSDTNFANNFFTPKNSTKFVFVQKSFLTKIIFWPNSFVDQNYFLAKLFYWPKFLFG